MQRMYGKFRGHVYREVRNRPPSRQGRRYGYQYADRDHHVSWSLQGQSANTQDSDSAGEVKKCWK